MRIYLAGPLFTSAEQQWNRELAAELRKYDHQTWVPQEHESEVHKTADIFKKDVEGLIWCNAIVANMDGPDPDSGTAWECCWGSQNNRLVFAYRTDFRNAECDGAPINLMIYCSVTKYVDCTLASPEVTATLLQRAFSDYAFGR